MKKLVLMLSTVVLSLAINMQAQAGNVETLQSEYQAAGAGNFSASNGEKMWVKNNLDKKSGKQRNCQTCHGKVLTQSGKHARTGKVIEPLARSVNSERLTDIKFMKKWLKRNCKWTIGRECSAQEKGDFLEYLKGQ
ncbi:MAG: DUF1924 domain-containing protein [Gammaproteobacteria bacterium]|nr:DUF1924 domain-containing protein [Gammaproteobacteria bacterium]